MYNREMADQNVQLGQLNYVNVMCWVNVLLWEEIDP